MVYRERVRHAFHLSNSSHRPPLLEFSLSLSLPRFDVHMELTHVRPFLFFLCSWLTLLNPVMFSRIDENTLHIFGAINFLSIPIIWALYPETANRTLEEMDSLFASKSPWVWDEEEHFKKLKAERPELEHGKRTEGHETSENEKV